MKFVTRTASGVRLSPRNLYPGYAKNAYPGLMFWHASGVRSPEGCRDISPGWSVFLRHRGLCSTR